MKISKQRLLEIIKEEISLSNEEKLTPGALEDSVEKILSSLPSEDQAIIRQYIVLSRGRQ